MRARRHFEMSAIRFFSRDLKEMTVCFHFDDELFANESCGGFRVILRRRSFLQCSYMGFCPMLRLCLGEMSNIIIISSSSRSIVIT